MCEPSRLSAPVCCNRSAIALSGLGIAHAEFGLRMEGKSVFRTRQSRWKVKSVLLLATMLTLLLATTAYAASYRYMSNDSLGPYKDRFSAACRYATTSYGHRLTGPSSLTMYQAAYHANSYCNRYEPWCHQQVNGNEAWCYPGGAYVQGYTLNYVGSSQSFNAHLSY